MKMAKAEFDDEIDLERLRERTSEKWTHYPPDVLPAFVAETDFPVPPAIARIVRRAVDVGDFGYALPHGLGNAYMSFARARYGIEIDPAGVIALPEVMVGVAEILRVVTDVDEPVVINPPVYPPFFATTAEVRRRSIEVPLLIDGAAAELDFEGLEAAFAAGARVYLLCNPHNPLGRVFSREDLLRIARLAERYGVLVLADEIHAPLVLPGAVHTPFEAVVAETGVHAITLTSASKGWNIAGLKCAVAASSSRFGRSVLQKLPKAMAERTGHLGALATVAAFTDDVPFLDRCIAHLDRQRAALQALFDDNGLSRIRYTPPQAGFLAWLDCRELGLGDDPAKTFLQRGRVALNPGLAFGHQGAGYARLNFATSSVILEEIVRRMAAAVNS